MKVLSPREAAIFAALADAVAMPEPPRPPVGGTDAVEGFDAWLASAPAANRAAIRAALLGLGTRLRGADRAARAETLRTLGRTPGVAPLMEALRAAAAATYYGDDGVMRRLGYDAGERVRRGAEVRAAATGAAAEAAPPGAAAPSGAATPSGGATPPAAAGGVVDLTDFAGERVVRADVCVIGSGAGGAVVAKELAEAGARVVLLEEGAQHHAAEFTARPRDMLPQALPRRRAARDARAAADPAPARPGGRRHDARQLRHLLPHARPVLARWRDEFGLEDLTPEALAPHFARVEEELNVVPVPPELAGANAHVAKRGADALGWSGDFVRRNVRGCVGSGVCAYGCPADAKQHVGVTYVPKAHAAGATTYTGVTARRLGRGVRGVDGRAAGACGSTRRPWSSPPAPSTRPRCSPATGSATTTWAATCASTPRPPCGP